ncbi:alcohol dehydrogenase catalytic domain-containing protein [Aestuariimicrobium ganziense]|uniref:alcohol dehydrogenase catalytic domain-containing protein n=1 Tax=Aestuariimicrobium ganziense TaxID=2773677 RepID=UPI001942F37D|nr:alcohol dehydrogenase catalytic domain-containing protein [Aestuariimicrobium ganziense]
MTTGPRRMELREVDEPAPRPGWAVVEVEAVGLCGSDFHIVDGTHFALHYPRVQGHEAIGRIAALPDDAPTSLAVGDRVAVEPLQSCGVCYACRRGRTNVCADLDVLGVHSDGALQERYLVPVGKLHPIGDLAWPAAVLVEPVTIALNALGRVRAGIGADDRVLVLGAGPIGLVTAIACLEAGAEVFVVDREPMRLQLAREVGVVRVADSSVVDVSAWVRELTDGEGPGVVVEATGVADLLRGAIDLVAPSGTVLVVGMSDQELTVPLTWFSRKEVDLLGARTSVDMFPSAVALARRQADRLARLVTHTWPLEQAGEAVRYAMAHPDEVCKAVVRVSAEGAGTSQA